MTHTQKKSMEKQDILKTTQKRFKMAAHTYLDRRPSMFDF